MPNKQRFAGFHVEPHYAMTSWTMVASTAAYVATNQGRRRAAYDRNHYVGLRDLKNVAMAKDFDLNPRLVKRTA